MKKTFKKIAASVMAAATLAVGSAGMSVNASNPSYEYGTQFGTLTCSISVSGSGGKTVSFKTTTGKTANTLTVSGDVANYTTGANIKSTGCQKKYSTSSISASITWPFAVGTKASAFGAHQAFNSSGSLWVVYTDKYNFSI